MWKSSLFSRLDYRIVPVIAALMVISLLVISSMTGDPSEEDFWTPLVKTQLRWFCLGWLVFFLASYFDYRRLRSLSPLLYCIMILLLAGLFFTSPIQNVHRWYKIPGVASLQPSEQAKLILVIFLSWFLERRGREASSLSTAIQMALIVAVPFLLILKQPDLGTALILCPIALALAYFGEVHRGLVRMVTFCALGALFVVALLFLGVLDHEKMRPLFTTVLKEYQYQRLNPNTYHQKASQIAIAIGGVSGSGWHKGEFSGRKWLPAAHTDSVFAAYSEEFGLVGVAFLLLLYYALIYFSFQVAAVAKDPFGRFLAAGLTVYLAMHVLFNIGMMCALLPISGVPLIFLTYGGSSILSTMGALGILQSIYSRRFMF
ncbi:MAG: FtsW/RodA/SpoVE family cell cycle protein [Verrucomicrobia bacterium]|nr:FtsW/RodA/SpoVE family cell cycle protein [Verrucomicrobiota bacterium]MBU6446442.1 FtsW/RodA/SpoVE family cell cycle protein [Verrucomicrobiota bacterium]MDE3048137.1 FtsW/RodA/SpoVE family cell cycle protein [Verrucomicrobiota bacterium]